MATHRICDIAIIGGSFAGLSAALQAARTGRRVLVFDTNKPRNRFASNSHGLLGHDGRPPMELRKMGEDNISHYPNTSIIRKGVSRVTPMDSPRRFLLNLENSAETFEASRVVLAFGVQDIVPDIPGLQAMWGKSLAQCPYCHGHEVRDQRFALLYVGPISLNHLTIVSEWSRDIVFLTNGAKLSEDELKSLQASKVKEYPEKIRAFKHVNGNLKTIEFENHSQLERDIVFSRLKFRLSSSIANDLGCVVTDGVLGPQIQVDPVKMETTVSGVYAAGDIIRPFHNLASSIADGVVAASFAHQSLLGNPL